MTNEQQELDEIIAYLASIGIEGPALKSKIAERLGLGLPYFNIEHAIYFEAEQIRCKLLFVLDNQFKSYQLEKYTAEYQGPIFIDHNGTEAVDVAKLDELMSQVHWGLFFKGGSVPGAGNSDLAKEALSQLNILSNSNSRHDTAIARKLICKFWPPDQLGSDASNYLNEEYTRKRDFDPSCHATTAFMILSGKMDDIYEKIRYTGADDLPGFDLYDTLSKKLISNPPNFILSIELFNQESFSKVAIPVQKIDNSYQIDQYTVSTSILPKILVGIYNQVNTIDLDREMALIDWSRDHDLFNFYESQEPSFKPHIEEIAARMEALKSDPNGLVAYDQLSLKYWPDSTFFSDLIRDEAWTLLENLPKYQMEFSIELIIPAAINLLCGRSIKESLLFESQPDLGEWVALKREALSEKGAYHYHHFNGFSSEQLKKLINLLPLELSKSMYISSQLERGDLAVAVLRDGQLVLLEANPEMQTVNIYTQDKRLIPVNMHFDPDWKPPSELVITPPKLDKVPHKKNVLMQTIRLFKGPSKHHP